jgi:hypothetical protein
MTENPLLDCTKIVTRIISHIVDEVGVKQGWSKPDDSEDEDLSVLLDEEMLLYFGHPISEAIKCVGEEYLTEGQEPYDIILNDDIINTYLKSGELVLVVGFSNKGDNVIVGAVDRSTGFAAIYPKNWLSIHSHVKISSDNRTEETFEFATLNPEPAKLSKTQKTLSQNRVLNLLQDCITHALCKQLGRRIEPLPEE